LKTAGLSASIGLATLWFIIENKIKPTKAMLVPKKTSFIGPTFMIKADIAINITQVCIMVLNSMFISFFDFFCP